MNQTNSLRLAGSEQLGMFDRLPEQSRLNELRRALEHNELSVVYQPQLDIRTGCVTGNEALLRWTHPRYGPISPAAFIPIAENSGLILPIGNWVLRTACRQNKAWRDAGFEPMTISVNLSPSQFAQGNLIETVKSILEETGLDPHDLDLEITESMTMDVSSVLPTLQELKTLGVQISMDDFGTGYSSLYYLKRLPLDTLKIDKSFVRECTIDESDATIVKTIISMAHHLKFHVIAEGVETSEHLHFLQQQLCDKAQGYLFSRPLSAEELERRLSDIRRVVSRQGISMELLERRWAEEQLHTARQELVDTVRRQLGVTFKVKREEGRFIHTLCEGELLARVNLTSEQVVGKELHDFFPQELTKPIRRGYERAFQGEPNVSVEGFFQDIYFVCTLRPIIRGGRVVEVVGNVFDITERKRMEDELRAAMQQWESFFQNTSDAMCVIDRSGRVKRMNRAFVSLFGWTKDELIGRDLPIVPEQLEAETRVILEETLSGKGKEAFETIRRHKDGSLVRVSLTVSPIKDRSGTVIASAGVIRKL